MFWLSHSNENKFDLHENKRTGETHFYVSGFPRRVVLVKRQKATQKWPFQQSKNANSILLFLLVT